MTPLPPQTSAKTRLLKAKLPIRADEVLTSTDMAARLAKERGISATSARQQIARAAQRGHIWRSKHFKLQAGGRLFAQLPYVGTERFLKSIRPALRDQRAGIGRVLDAMLQNQAIHLNSVKMLLAASALADPADGIPSFASEMNALQELGIGRLDETGSGAPRLVRTALYDTAESRALGHALAATQLLNRQLTEFLYRDFQKQNIVIWAPIPDAESEQYFNNQWFSAHGFSKLRPMMRYEKGKEPVSCATVFDVRSGIAGVSGRLWESYFKNIILHWKED